MQEKLISLGVKELVEYHTSKLSEPSQLANKQAKLCLLNRIVLLKVRAGLETCAVSIPFIIDLFKQYDYQNAVVLRYFILFTTRDSGG